MKLLELQQYAQRNTADAVRRARKRTAAVGKPTVLQTVAQSLRASPTKDVLRGLMVEGRQDCVLGIDLSKYERGQDMRPYYDAGARHFIFRMGGPTLLQLNDWRFEIDPAWHEFFEAARALGSDVRVGGYWVYIAGVDQVDFENSNVSLTEIERCMSGGYVPDMLWIDDEVNYWWVGSTKVYATAYNQVKGVRTLISKARARFLKTVGHYSAAWFLSQTAEYKAAYMAWLNEVNLTEKTVPIWRAWYPGLNAGLYTDLRSFVNDKVIVPTSTQIAAYLTWGNSPWDLWQCQGDFVSLWGKVDINFSRQSAADFDKLFSMTAPIPTPDDSALAARVQQLENWRAAMSLVQLPK